MEVWRISVLLVLGVAAGYIAIYRKPSDRRMAGLLFYAILLLGVMLIWDA